MKNSVKVVIVGIITVLVILAVLFIAKHPKQESQEVVDTYMALDTDQNGSVSKELFTNGRDTNIYVKYTNSDGEITLYELTDANGNVVTFQTLGETVEEDKE